MSVKINMTKQREAFAVQLNVGAIDYGWAYTKNRFGRWSEFRKLSDSEIEQVRKILESKAT